MCGCSTHQSQPGRAIEHAPDALVLRVEDIVCSHCASTIAKAVEAGLPGAKVEADPSSKMVFVRGTRDLEAVKAIVCGAGYTPVETELV
jgi:copper chaperone